MGLDPTEDLRRDRHTLPAGLGESLLVPISLVRRGVAPVAPPPCVRRSAESRTFGVMSIRFPDDFLWGAATAGHQVEGGNINAHMWPMEWAHGTTFAEPSGDACDHYHRYREDIATLASLGLNTYRFSVEWSRIEPEPGFFSRAALDHYRRMTAACHEHSVTPVVTYCHFTTPRWFADMGSWRNKSAPELFGRFAERVTAHLGDLVPWACTLNEPNLSDLLRQIGWAPAEGSEPDQSDIATIAGPGIEVMADVHRRAVEAIRSGPGDTRVGWTLVLVDFQPVEGGEERCQKARHTAELDWLEVSQRDDFVGVQSYTRQRLGPTDLWRHLRISPRRPRTAGRSIPQPWSIQSASHQHTRVYRCW